MLVLLLASVLSVLSVAAAVPSDPKAAAAAMTAKMTLDEKVRQPPHHARQRCGVLLAATLTAARACAAAWLHPRQVSMLHGKSDGYVGNTPAIPRLGIPPLNLNDGPQGFRSGETTAFPSGLTAAASFSREDMSAWGTAMGEEFFTKGANVQLGPGLCVARVPRNGRNFECVGVRAAWCRAAQALPVRDPPVAALTAPVCAIWF